MKDLASILKRVNKGTASESAIAAFSGKLEDQKRLAESAIVNAYEKGDDQALRFAVAQWLGVRKIFRAFEFDIKDGDAAQKEQKELRE